MTAEEFSDELAQDPFIPLRLHLSDGRTLDIKNPDEAVISHQSVYVFKLRRDNRHITDDTRLINLLQVVSVEKINKPTARPGKKAK